MHYCFTEAEVQLVEEANTTEQFLRGHQIILGKTILWLFFIFYYENRWLNCATSSIISYACLCVHLCLCYVVMDMWLHVHLSASVCGGLMLMAGSTPHYSCTLYLESWSLSQSRSPKIWLVFVASLLLGWPPSVFWAGIKGKITWH